MWLSIASIEKSRLQGLRRFKGGVFRKAISMRRTDSGSHIQLIDYIYLVIWAQTR
jgi:hypothetical protein